MSFGREYIHMELGRLDEKIEDEIKLYLIGGGNMSLLGLKDATKDIDVILDGEKDLYLLKKGLLECGYREAFSPIYRRMGSRLLMENEDGFRWDVFVETICHGLILSPYIRQRSMEYHLYLKNLRLLLLSKEDVFLFKGVTERDRDLEDMHILFLQGLDFKVIVDEIRWQSKHSKVAWTAYLLQRLRNLQEEYGVVIPGVEEIEGLAEEDVATILILDKLSNRDYTIEELLQEFHEDREYIKMLIKKLEDRGEIERRGDMLIRRK